MGCIKGSIICGILYKQVSRWISCETRVRGNLLYIVMVVVFYWTDWRRDIFPALFIAVVWLALNFTDCPPLCTGLLTVFNVNDHMCGFWSLVLISNYFTALFMNILSSIINFSSHWMWAKNVKHNFQLFSLHNTCSFRQERAEITSVLCCNCRRIQVTENPSGSL